MDFESWNAQLSIFLTGVLDSLYFHRTFPLLMKSKVLAGTTFKIIAANSVLLLGSLVLFHKAITPGLAYMTQQSGSAGAINDIIAGLFYALFVVPIYLLCYSTSMVGYQTLADEMYQSKKKDQTDTSIPRLKGLVDGTYATVAWLCLFVQLQLLNVVFPMLLRQIHSFLSVTMAEAQVIAMASSSTLTPISTTTFTSKLIEIGLPYFKSLVLMLVSQSITLTHMLGWILMSVMYGWYAFDAHWITINVDPDTRFKILEKHWAYFLGFGIPYTILVKNVSFFVGYGSYMALFPFCIMLGGISDYEKPYKEYNVSSTSEKCSKGPVLMPLRLFKTAQIWTLSILSLLRKSRNGSTKTTEGGGSGMMTRSTSKQKCS